MEITTQKQPDWDQLLLRSEELVQQDFAFPRVQLDVHQIEQFSQRLRSKTVRGDSTAEALDASRLLAQEGLNPRKIDQALQTFELHPTHEDVFKVETASVDEYLKQVHEMIAVAAVQEAQRSSVTSFEGHMDSCMAAEWTREKRALLDSIEPFSVAVRKQANETPFSAAHKIRSAEFGAPVVLLRGRAGRYADVVHKINAASAAGERYAAVSDFVSACAGDPGGGSDQRTTMMRVWHVVQHQIQGVYGLPSSAHSQREASLIAGSRSYLEENYVSYLQTVVQTHRTVAALGGSPSRLGLVNAYLRVHEKDRGGVLDFDQPGGADTSWLRLYCCLRAGFFSEAAQLARALDGSTPPHRAGTAAARNLNMSALLQEWSDNGCRPLSGDAGAAALTECERLLRDRTTVMHGGGGGKGGGVDATWHYRILVYALLAGSNRAADAVARESPSIFPTIEDFLWLKLGLVRPSGSSSGSAMASSGVESFTLSDLQQYLNQYPAAHYSHGGREPLLYAVVLILSLQPAAAVAFLARDPSAREFRLDAVHLGICLWQANALDQMTPSHSRDGGVSVGGAAPVAPSESSGSVSSLVGQYARSLAHGDVQVALEYYMLAGAVRGGSLAVRGSLLRELLTETRAYGLLLGAGGTAGEGGALATFIPDPAERAAVLEAVAGECAAAAQLEEAVELFMVAGRPRQALRILNQRLSDAVEPAAAASKSDEADTLTARGNAAVSALGNTRDPGDLREVEAFEQLKVIRAVLDAASHGDRTRVLQALGELSFVPTERYRLQVCASAASALHPAVADRLQAVLLAVSETLASVGKWDELQTVVSFAAAVPNRVSQTAYQRLNQLQAAA